jgi:hypothetical protein
VVATKTVLVEAAVDGDGGKRYSAGRCLLAFLDGKERRISKRGVRSVQGAKVERKRGSPATATFTGAKQESSSRAKNREELSSPPLWSVTGGDGGMWWRGKGAEKGADALYAATPAHGGLSACTVERKGSSQGLDELGAWLRV